jgi:hypothetical protein
MTIPLSRFAVALTLRRRAGQDWVTKYFWDHGREVGVVIG